jgi:hypothetical protein
MERGPRAQSSAQLTQIALDGIRHVKNEKSDKATALKAGFG